MLRTEFYRNFVQSNCPSSSSEDPSLSSGPRSPSGTFGSGVGNSRDSSIGQLEIIYGIVVRISKIGFMIITCTVSPKHRTRIIFTSSCSVIPLFLPSMSYEAEDVNKHITNSDDWGISKFKLSNLSAIAKQFHFVAHENPSNSGDKVNGEQFPPTNHWSLLLTLLYL